MSTDIAIPISVLIFLVFLVWRINRKINEYPANTHNKIKRTDNKSSLQNNSNNVDTNKPSVMISDNDNNKPAPIANIVPEEFLNFKLLNAENINEEQRKTIVAITQSFRKPHPLLLPLTRSVFEPNELFNLIKTDAEITAKVLNVVNSPLLGLRQPITNINHAIIFLGITEVKNIAMQVAMQNQAESTDKLQNQAFQKLWSASYMASAFCLLFAKKIGAENPAELSTHCLLSYLGDLAILAYKPSLAGFYVDDYTLYERTKVIQSSLETNTAVVGKFLSQQWQLPESIEKGIEHSLLPLTSNQEYKKLTSEEARNTLLCYLACRLGDLVAFNGIRDVSQIGEISFESLGKLEFYHIQEHIQQAHLEQINTIIANQGFRNKINQLISQVTS